MAAPFLDPSYALDYPSNWTFPVIEVSVLLLAAGTFKASRRHDLSEGKGGFPSTWFLARIFVFMFILEFLMSHGKMNASGASYWYCLPPTPSAAQLQTNSADQTAAWAAGELDACRRSLRTLHGNEKAALAIDRCRGETPANIECKPAPYRYPSSFWLTLPGGVPLWVPAGWAVIFYATGYTAQRMFRSPLTQGVLMGLLAVMIDLALDPVAHYLGWWVWGERGATTFFAVPVTNYAAWFVLVTVISTLWYSYFRVIEPGTQSGLPGFLRPLSRRVRQLKRWEDEATQATRRNKQASVGWLLLGAVPFLPPLVPLFTRTFRPREPNADSWTFTFGRALLWMFLRTVVTVLPYVIALALVVRVSLWLYAADRGQPGDVYIGALLGIITLVLIVLLVEFPARHSCPLDLALLRVPIVLFTLFIILYPKAHLDERAETRDLAVALPLLASASMGVFIWPYLDDLFERGLIRVWVPRALRGWWHERVDEVRTRVLRRP